MIHVIDLDGAKAGSPKNFDLIVRMKKTLNISMQVGGGIRSFEAAAAYIEAGIDRVIIGTRALSDAAFLKKLIDAFGAEKIVVSIDIKNGKVALNGWTKVSDVDYLDFAKELLKLGVKNVLCTDISKDGMLESPEVEPFEALNALGLNVVAAGGISDWNAINEFRKAGVYGAVLGKALYEGKINLSSDLAKRIIPCLDVKEGRVVKGVNFLDLTDAGESVELGKKYSDEGADELIFLDITASQDNRNIMLDMVRRVAESVFIPFTVGGGIRTVDDVREVLQNGADKISLNTAAVKNPSLISEIADVFGSQCVVVAIDIKKVGDKYKVFIKGGREETELEALAWAMEVERLGAGEILLTSMDRDGTKKGFDNEISRQISDVVGIPVIASGGVGNLEHLKDGIVDGHADAVLAASIFHYGKYSIKEVKEYLKLSNIPVRL